MFVSNALSHAGDYDRAIEIANMIPINKYVWGFNLRKRPRRPPCGEASPIRYFIKLIYKYFILLYINYFTIIFYKISTPIDPFYILRDFEKFGGTWGYPVAN